MTNPINLQIKRTDNTWDIIEAAPFVKEDADDLLPTGVFQLYRGYPEFDSNLIDADELRKRYMANILLVGDVNPDFLGELHFTGLGYFEWRYVGNYLEESEVWQVVECIQEHASGKVPVMGNGIILPKNEPPEQLPLMFKFGKNQIVSNIRIEEMGSHFIIFINDELTAQIELLEREWEVTGGDINDDDLLDEVRRRIRANT